MPRGDGTGPLGKGAGTGRCMGGGQGRGGGFRLGPEGYCVCTSCGEKVPHTVGVPCTSIVCPKCGSPMTRAT